VCYFRVFAHQFFETLMDHFTFLNFVTSPVFCALGVLCFVGFAVKGVSFFRDSSLPGANKQALSRKGIALIILAFLFLIPSALPALLSLSPS